MLDCVALQDDRQSDDVAKYEKVYVRHEDYEEKRRRAELILERKRLRQLLDEDELDFDW